MKAINTEQFKLWIRAGTGLFLWTFAFFYGHLSLVIISLIPSTFRVLQRLQAWHAPIWMEICVEATRVVLFLLIIALMEKINVRRLFQKSYWIEFHARYTAHMKHNWPEIFIVQLIAFVVLMYVLMNGLISLIVNEYTVNAFMKITSIKHYDEKTIAECIIFFLKNMSIIPMSIVYIVRMLGFGTNR